MNAEIITIGDEILIGQIVDTNSAWMAGELESVGIRVVQITSIPDKENAIINALSGAKSRADIVLITGGLGPTNDDITKMTLCKYFGSKLEFNQDVYSDVEEIFNRFNSTVSAINKKQAEVPDNCTIIRNKNGTAPGMWFDENDVVYISMPGVPYEMQALMQKDIIPKLKKRFVLPDIVHRTILTHGIGESNLSEMLVDWEASLAEQNIKLAYLPAPGTVRLRVSGNESNKIESKLKELEVIIGQFIFGYEEDTMEKIVVDLLKKQQKTVSTAESCTGGYTAHLITSISGSSEVYKGSVIAYKNDIKEKELNVNQNDLEQHGAVSQEVVEAMARGVKE
ncbi:MAG: CinA family nicotinamide mononucleotide deamidase-related protein, partial [Bacteroidetes bacterium]|nr:CinA family nicotinamide mononucleotide deamidase-related protein [Bacteroidota bacterium]